MLLGQQDEWMMNEWTISSDHWKKHLPGCKQSCTDKLLYKVIQLIVGSYRGNRPAHIQKPVLGDKAEPKVQVKTGLLPFLNLLTLLCLAARRHKINTESGDCECRWSHWSSGQSRCHMTISHQRSKRPPAHRSIKTHVMVQWLGWSLIWLFNCESANTWTHTQFQSSFVQLQFSLHFFLYYFILYFSFPQLHDKCFLNEQDTAQFFFPIAGSTWLFLQTYVQPIS